MNEFVTEIEQLIAKDKLDILFERLLNNLSEQEIKSQIILLSSRFNDIKNRNNKGVLSFDNYNIEKSKILAALLEVTKEIRKLSFSPSENIPTIIISDYIEPKLYKDQIITITKSITAKGLIQFQNCTIEIQKSDILFDRLTSIIFTNCKVLIQSSKIYSENGAIGENLKFVNCDLEIYNVDFINLNQLTVKNTDKNLKTIFSNLVFDKFNNWISIETISDEITVVDNCVFTKFEKNVMYINSIKTMLTNIVVNKCTNGIVVLVENSDYYTCITDAVFSKIEENALEFTINSQKSRLYITDIVCAKCDTGIKIEMQNEEPSKSNKGELIIEERIVINNLNTENCIQGIVINGYDE